MKKVLNVTDYKKYKKSCKKSRKKVLKNIKESSSAKDFYKD